MKYGAGTRKLRRLICFVLVTALLGPHALGLGLSLGGAARAETKEITFTARTWNGTTKRVEQNDDIKRDATRITSDTRELNGWYYVEGEVTVEDRMTVTGTAQIILCDGAKLTVNGGINVSQERELHIYGQSGDSGELHCYGLASQNAAIGSDNEAGDCGKIYIYGGKVTAETWGEDAAGIGGGDGCHGGTVTILGGTVTAIGGECGAGIGGGDGDGVGGNGGTVTIYGGNVTAIGGDDAAGIGGGEGGHGGNFTIWGGTVLAKGGSSSYDGGAGIGGGDDGHGGTITIHGGTISAEGGADGAGIGGGDGGDGGTIMIHGGTVHAQGGEDGAGIGGGDGGSGGTITIDGAIEGCLVDAKGGDNGAGIGGGDADGDHKTGGTITISGGTVTARGGVRGAGIGGGEGGGGGVITITGGKIDTTSETPYSQHGAAGIGSGHRDGRTYPRQKITISGGEITAEGAAAGAGIGGGYDAEGGEITITGGTINATGGCCEPGAIDVDNEGAGIGGGKYGSGGTIRITGGNVTAKGGDLSSAAGIGGGLYGPGGDIRIEGRDTVVRATSDSGSAIGSGARYEGDQKIYDSIHIENTTIEAMSHLGAGIGGTGDEADPVRGDIKIINATVEAFGGVDGAGIGGSGTGGTILIQNSSVLASGITGVEHSGAGIGGSNEGGVGRITIIGSNVRARGGGGAAGIGGGSPIYGYGDGWDVTIQDSYIEAEGGEHRSGAIGMGIGGGYNEDKSQFAKPGSINLKPPAAVRVSDDYTMWNFMDDIDRDVYQNNHQYHNVIIKSVFTVRYDPNGATAGYPPESQEVQYGGTITVAGKGTLVDQTRVFDGWDHFESGKTYKQGDRITPESDMILVARWVNEPVSYMDWDGTTLVEKTGDEACKEYEVVTPSTTTLEAGKWYVVTDPTTTIHDRLTVSGTGETHLILENWVDLNAQKGITVSEGSSLILHGQSKMNGTLTAMGVAYEPGIGGGDCGTIIVNGCNVTATGGNYAAGIGGGGVSDPNLFGGKGGMVTVNGGTVTATGGQNGAGIGGGANSANPDWSGAGGTVIVNGGTVKATGGESAKGIGAGYDRSSSDDELIVAITHIAYSDTSEITDATKSNPDKRKEGTGSASTISRNRYMLVEPGSGTHIHDFTYSISEDGATIIATCGADHCPLPGHCVKLKIVKPTKNTYSAGTGFGVSAATLSGLDAFNEATEKFVAEKDIRYVGRDGTAYGESATPPENAGKYTAKITLDHVKTGEGADKTVTAFVDYEIAKADPYAKVPTGTAVCGQTLADVTLRNPIGNTPGKWVWVDASQSVGAAGAHTFKANFIPEDTNNYHAWNDVDVTVNVSKAHNPATVHNKAVVIKGGNTVNLADLVKKNGAEGIVRYRISSADKKGCSIDADAGTLTSGSETGEITVTVTIGADDYYEAMTATITVIITEKQTQAITADDVTATYGDTGKKVEASSTAGTAVSYAVKSGYEAYIDVNSSTGDLTIKRAGTAVVIVTAPETDTYAEASKEVTVTIGKAAPTANPPTGLTAIYGQTLADVALPNPEGNTPGTWTWKDSSTTSVGPAGGGKTFKANFTPDDTKNYQSLSDVDVTVTVRKAPNPATVISTASVQVKNTVNLAENVRRNGATGTVSYAISGDPLDCTVNGEGVLTSKEKLGTVTVNVTVGEDTNYLESEAMPITVAISAKTIQDIRADDVTTQYGNLGAMVSASVNVPEGGYPPGAISYAVKPGDESIIAVSSTSGLLTIKKAGTATVIVTAAETEHYALTRKLVTVTINKGMNPATVTGTANVIKGGNTVDLSKNVSRHGATGTVSYEIISEDKKGCVINSDGILTSGNTTGTVTVNVTVAEDENYLASNVLPITVTINDKASQTISADPVTTTYGTLGAMVSAKVTEPATGGGAISYAVMVGSEDYIEVNAVSGLLTIKKVPAGAGTAYVIATAAETPTHNQASIEVPVTINKAPNPAIVGGIATVAKGGKTVDLASKVRMNDATGAVSYAFSDEAQKKGCELAGSVLTTGTETGIVVVNVSIAADDNYEALSAKPIYVLILDKEGQTILAEDITTTVGATDAKVNAVVTVPAEGGGAISYAVRKGDEVYINIDPKTGVLTVKKVGAAIVEVRAEETADYRRTKRDVTVTILGSEYQVVAGDGQVWRKQSATGAIFTVKRSIRDEQTFGLFQSLMLDGTTEVLPASYDAKAGSLVLMLEPAYLNTLPVGSYTLDFRFEDGTAAATMTILEAETPTPAPTDAPEELPRTGDTSNVGLWVALTALGIAAAALLLWLIRKKKP